MHFFAIILFIISIYSYNVKKKETLSHIDNKLFVAALSIKNLLYKDFHDRAINSDTISTEEDTQNIKALSEFTNRAGCTFLYTLIKNDDAIYITASNATKEELDQNLEVRYFTHFKESDENFYRAFDGENAYSFTHKDRWGEFRAMAVPELSPDGKPYLSVAEFEISHINKILKSNALETILAGILIICGSLPLFYLLLNRVQQISEKHKKTEQQLQQAQKLESIGRLAGGVAHDYNNLSSVIIGYSELALDGLDSDHPLYNNLKEILKAAERSTDITRQLLAFARKQTIEPVVVDINNIVKNMLKMLARLVGEDIELQWLPGDDIYLLKIDPSQIDQILANLCVNSRDAIKDVGKISIETKNSRFDTDYCTHNEGFIPGKYVMIAVSDNGKGISPENIENIFDPFFTTKGLGKGTGLGLATVYGITKQNNGFVKVYSEPEIGTTIRIYLPEHSEEPVMVESKNIAKIPKGHNETILFVEDDVSILKLGKKILQTLGYKVLISSTPIDAIRLASDYEGVIDLLITDVVMPEMNGRELSERIKHIYPNLNIIFISGYTANIIAHRGVLEDGINFVSKPFTKEAIASKIKEVLNQSIGNAQK